MSHTDRTVLERQKEFGGDVFLARHLLLNPTIGRLADAIDRSSFASLRAQEETEGFHERPTKTDRFFREGRAGQRKGHFEGEPSKPDRQGSWRTDGALRLPAGLIGSPIPLCIFLI
jgi:hypothetical protein